MKDYNIYEEGVCFATVKALNGKSALRKAAKEYPRNAYDYNLNPGQKYKIVWVAFESNKQEATATAEISVPGTSDYGCNF